MEEWKFNGQIPGEQTEFLGEKLAKFGEWRSELEMDNANFSVFKETNAPRKLAWWQMEGLIGHPLTTLSYFTPVSVSQGLR